MNIIKKYKESEFSWDKIKENEIKQFPWDKITYKPKTNFKLGITEVGIKVCFIGTDKNVVIDKKENNSRVYQDSCVEFFFNPDSNNSDDYINLEVTAKGVALGQIGPDAVQRVFLTNKDIEDLNIETDVNDQNVLSFDNFKPWCVKYTIPFELLNKYYPKFSKNNFKILKCNFYKCGDKTQHAHYGCYFNINYHKPSFHRPEFFGEFLIE